MSDDKLLEPYFKQGVDTSPVVNLQEGYMSEWANREGNTVTVRVYNHRESYLVFYEERGASKIAKDIWKDLEEEELEEIARMSGGTLEEERERRDNMPVSFIFDADMYCGIFTETARRFEADNLIEVVEGIIE